MFSQKIMYWSIRLFSKLAFQMLYLVLNLLSKDPFKYSEPLWFVYSTVLVAPFSLTHYPFLNAVIDTNNQCNLILVNFSFLIISLSNLFSPTSLMVSVNHVDTELIMLCLNLFIFEFMALIPQPSITSPSILWWV